MTYIPVEIENLRKSLEIKCKCQGLYAELYKEMTKCVTVVNDESSNMVSTKPLEVMIYANYKTEALLMIKDCVIYAWLENLRMGVANMDSPLMAQCSILPLEANSLGKFNLGPVTSAKSDELLRKGINPIRYFDRRHLSVFGCYVWRFGKLQIVNIDELLGKFPSWHKRVCLATFVTGGDFTRLLPSNIERIWK